MRFTLLYRTLEILKQGICLELNVNKCVLVSLFDDEGAVADWIRRHVTQCGEMKVQASMKLLGICVGPDAGKISTVMPLQKARA